MTPTASLLVREHAHVEDATPAVRLDVLYREHFGFVWRSLLRLGVHEAAVEDVVQDVFLVVRRRLVDFDPKRPARAWIFGIVRRVASEHHRYGERARRRNESAPRVGALPDPEEQASMVEAADAVRAFLATLDEERRLVFVLAELEGLSGTEIADALHTNRNTVYSRLRWARKRFETMVATLATSRGGAR